MRSILIILILVVSCTDNKINKPPLAPSKIAVDDYYGVKVSDPYRNLENLEDSTVINWMKHQQQYALNILEAIPKRDELIKKFQEFDNQKSFDISKMKVTDNETYFYLKRLNNEESGKLYYRKGLKGNEQFLYDPKNYKQNDSISYIIDYIKPDWKGKKTVVSLSKKGSEVSEIIFIDVETKTVLPYTLTNCSPNTLGEITWLGDSSGVIYQRFVSKNIHDKDIFENTESVLFKFEDSKNNNRVILSRETQKGLDIKPEDFPYASFKHLTDQYALGEISGATYHADTYYTGKYDIEKEKPNWKLLFRATEKIRKYGLKGDTLYYLTAKDASNYKICKVDIKSPDFDNPIKVVSEKKDRVIKDFVLTKDGIYFTTVKNGVEAKLYHLINDKERELKLPNSSGRIKIASNGIAYPNLWVTSRGWTSPDVRYSYDLNTDTFIKADLNSSQDISEFSDIAIEEIEVPSHDGVLVPLSLIYKKEDGIRKNKPTLISAYGAYGSSMSPFFSVPFLNFVNEGGVFAVAHVRGGGEKGDDWHKGGFKETKPNSWKDFIACTKYLINKGYTSKEQTIAIGASAGGITIGRAITERPDLYAACIAIVPSINVLRYEVQPNGTNHIKEYGSHKDSLKFRALLEMDSYHQIKEGEHYPATLITTGINDSRVVAWNPTKFAARLQAANSSDNPILLSVDFNSGHLAANNGKLKNYERSANFVSFSLWQTGHPDFQLSEDALKKNVQ